VPDTHIIADKSRISQVIGNLLDNAVQYSPQGGQVTVRLQEQGNMYLISVIDQGIGVNPEHYEHIFERFYRVSNTPTRQYLALRKQRHRGNNLLCHPPSHSC